MSQGEFDAAVGKLPPVFDHRHVSPVPRLVEDFAGFQTRRIDRERQYLGPSNVGHSLSQIMGANQHVISIS
jgi:hypothetical protein